MRRFVRLVPILALLLVCGGGFTSDEALAASSVDHNLSPIDKIDDDLAPGYFNSCGTSLGGFDTAYDDAFGQATRACRAFGADCEAVPVVSYPTQAGGWYIVCIDYYCRCGGGGPVIT